MAEEKDGIKKEGNLQKQSRWIKSWRTRWTVLKPYPKDGNDYLATFKKEKEKV